MDPTSQRIFLGSSATGDSYWINTLSTNNNVYPAHANFDSAGNVYVFGYTDAVVVSSQYDALICKLNSSGFLQQQYAYGDSQSNIFYSGTTDTSGNILATGYGTYPATGNTGAISIKTGPTGNILSYNYIGNSATYGRDILTDSSSNIYVLASDYSRTGTGEVVVRKYDSSFNLIQGTYIYDPSGYAIVPYSFNFDTSGNIYTFGYGYTSGIIGMNVNKLNSSGVLQSSWVYTNNVNQLISQRGSVDSSGNIYVCGYGTTNGSYQTAKVLKLNSSGAFTWQKDIDVGLGCFPSEVRPDSAGNVYVFGRDSSVNCVFVVKFNSSGTVLWQRKFTTTNGDTLSAYRMAIDSKNNLYLSSLRQSTYSQCVTIKYPSDGSKVGTFGSFIIASASYSINNESLTQTTPSYGSGNSGLSSPGYVPVRGTPTLTSAKVDL